MLDARANLDDAPNEATRLADMPALAPNIAVQDLQLGLGFATRLAAATTTLTNATRLVDRLCARVDEPKPYRGIVVFLLSAWGPMPVAES